MNKEEIHKFQKFVDDFLFRVNKVQINFKKFDNDMIRKLKRNFVYGEEQLDDIIKGKLILKCLKQSDIDKIKTYKDNLVDYE